MIDAPRLRELVAEGLSELARSVGRDDSEAMGLAVRSSAVGEDLPDASYAGVYDSTLNVSGIDAVVDACVHLVSGIYSDRAVQYRLIGGAGEPPAMAALVQLMVEATDGAAGVALTVDPDSNFENAVVINAVRGLGSILVDGSVEPDEYLVFKPALRRDAKRSLIGKRIGRQASKHVVLRGQNHFVALTDAESSAFVLTDSQAEGVGNLALLVEDHLGELGPLEIEWAFDDAGVLWLLQARPLVNRVGLGPVLRTYSLTESGSELVQGTGIGRKIAVGVACVMHHPQPEQFPAGAILVTKMTDPSWIPVMRKASGMITELGGRTSHAAIVAREMGIPTIVGAGGAVRAIPNGSDVTIACMEDGVGRVYAGRLSFDVTEVIPTPTKPKTRLMFLTGLPEAALSASNLPNDGVAMGREEFIVTSYIGVHPYAFVNYPQIRRDRDILAEIDLRYGTSHADLLGDVVETVMRVSRGYPDKSSFLLEKLVEGMAKIAASVYPKPAFMKLCDYKSNEFRALPGGVLFEPVEMNPMIGWRSASRFYAAQYRPIFEVECAAFRTVREEMGMSNMHLMIPFCRSVREAHDALAALREQGIVRGRNGLRISAEVEVPASIIEMDRFAELFDIFNIGANDLTQMVLGVDRDSALLSHLFDECDPAVLRFIAEAIAKVHSHHRMIDGVEVRTEIGLTGVRVSDDPALARFLIEHDIDFIGLDPEPETFLRMRENVLAIERDLGLHGDQP